MHIGKDTELAIRRHAFPLVNSLQLNPVFINQVDKATKRSTPFVAAVSSESLFI